MSEPNSGPPIELPDEGQLAEVAALVEAEAEAQDAIADNLIEQILLVWLAFSVLEGVRPGAQFYDGISVADFGRQVSRLVIAAQQAAGQTTEAYLREQFERMGEDLPDRTVVDLPEDLRLGAAAADVYQRPIRQIRYWQSVDMPLEEAVDRATDRLERQALADLQLARTTASQQLFFVTNPERITGWRRIIHPELGNVCGLCIAASDRLYRRIERMDLHPGCVVEGTEVSATGVGAATRRWYEGTVAVLRTSEGKELRLTRNHPVLTDRGWVQAGLLRKGDRVVRHSGSHRDGGRGPDEQQRPTRVEDLWRALTVSANLLPRTVPLAPKDLHGEGADGEVDVVLVDRHLAPIGDTTFLQPCRELGLVGAHSGRLSLPAARSFDLLSTGLFSAPSSITGGGSESRSLSVIQAGVTKLGSFGLRADRYFSAPESPNDGGAGYAEVGRQLLDWLSGQVEFSELVEVDVVAWSGHVYNLETSEGWYDACSIVVSNCKCTTLPITVESDPGRNLNAEDLRRLYEAAGSTATEALREVRVEVQQNGELGDILTPKQVEMRGPAQVNRQLSDRARQLRREQIERQIAELRARPRRSQWFDDRILQLEDLLETA